MSDGPPPVLAVELIRWSWVSYHLDDIGGYLLQHVQLTVLAVLFGLLLAFPLALAAIRWPRLYAPILGLTGILFTIPSLALFILLIPFTGLSTRTALIGLTIYTLLILVRNMVEGLRGVDRDVREAAQAMGYTPARQLFRVELPLALPVIMAGIRIATVTTIGLVTIGGMARATRATRTGTMPKPTRVNIRMMMPSDGMARPRLVRLTAIRAPRPVWPIQIPMGRAMAAAMAVASSE